MKKSLIIFAILATCLCFALAGCDFLSSGGDNKANPTFDCTDLDHTFVENTCTKCGKTLTATNGLEFELLPDDTYAVTNYIGDAANIVIPHTYNGKLVSTIEDAFNENEGIRSIYIPNGVTTIGDFAFDELIGLESIVLPNSVTSIGDEAFQACERLESVTIGSGLTHVSEVFPYLFYGCFHLECITISKDNPIYYSAGNCIIEKETGKLCFGAHNSVIPNDGSVKIIGEIAFLDTLGLKSFVIPEGVTTIEDCAFECCDLHSVTLPSTLTSIGEGAFAECFKLIEVYNKSSLDLAIGEEENGSVAYYAKNVYSQENGSKLSTDKNGFVRYTDGEDVILVAYNGDQAAITISSDVTELWCGAFEFNQSLTAVVIPANVKTIGNGAFYNCKSLQTISLTEGVENIGEDAFSESAITSVTIPASVEYLGNHAFSYCENLSSVTFVENSKISTLERSMFTYCTSLKSVKLAEGLTTIGYYAFSDCYNLAFITIPSTVTAIESGAFSDCYKLVEVKNLSNIDLNAGGDWDNGEIKRYAKHIYTEGDSYISTDTNGFTLYSHDEDVLLLNYTGKQTNVTIPSTVTEIYNNAFYNSNDVTSVSIPASVKAIGIYAFYRCVELKTVTFATNSLLTDIGGWAFAYCKNLKAIDLPSNANSFGMGAFENCSSLESFAFPEGTERIRSNVLNGCIKISELTLPSTVTTIENQAFNNCISLTSIELPAALTNLGSAFDGCSKLNSLRVAEGNNKYRSVQNCVIEIASKMLILGCSTSVIPSDGSVTIIGYSAFSGCKNIKEITLPACVTDIRSEAFSGCSGLTSIDLSNVTSLLGGAFRDCTGLTSVTIPSSLTSIEYSVFSGCTNLTSIAFEAESQITRIGDTAFGYCTSLQSIVLPESTLTLGWGAFEYCKALQTITIPASVQSIERYAFDGCKSLQTINFLGTKEQWNTITYGRTWSNTGEYVVHCTDGDLAKPEDSDEHRY